MTRQTLSNKSVAKLSKQLKIADIAKGMVRGNTDHRRDLCLTDGSMIHLYRDGSTDKSDMRWK